MPPQWVGGTGMHATVPLILWVSDCTGQTIKSWKKINRNLLCIYCVNFTNFYTQNSTDTKFLFEFTVFYTRKWACDKANGVCGIKLVHFSCSFITTVNCCPAVQWFIVLQVVIGRHPVATVLYWLPCHGDCEPLCVVMYRTHGWRQTHLLHLILSYSSGSW